MPANVEERIVAAKFDSTQFEKGVDKTIKKLDELKKGFNFDKAGESITDLSKKTNEAAESANKNIEKLSKSFTTFTGMMKQKVLSALADEIVSSLFKIKNAITGFFSSMTTGQFSAGMAKYEAALTSVRMIVNSYKNLLNGSRVNYSETEAYQAIENLQTYADETSYSMQQMTDSMSKMVAAGVKLEDAEKNVQGIANACAAAGVNAQDAQRAFFNLSQAYSSGSLKYTDYRSLELLNMTNENFQEQILAAAELAGTLKKVKDGIWKTKKSDTNKKVTAGKTVTKKSLAESLKYGFVDTDVMDILFGQNYYVDVEDFYDAQDYSDNTQERVKYLTNLIDTEKLANKELEKVVKNLDAADKRKKQYMSIKDAKTRKEYLKTLQDDTELMEKAEVEAMDKIIKGLEDTDERKKKYLSITDEKERLEYVRSLEKEKDIMEKLPKKYTEMAAKAFLAAREARNFHDVINAIGDYVSSKFSKIFEHLFGTLETASQFFTKLSEGGIAKIFTGIADYMLEVVEAWDTAKGSVMSGGEMFRESILSIDNTFKTIGAIFGELMPSASDLGWTLQLLTVDLREATQQIAYWVAGVKEWLDESDSIDDSRSRLDKFRQSLANLSGVFTIIGKVIGIAAHAFDKALEVMSPIFDGINNALLRITQPISDLSTNDKVFNDLSYSIDNLFTVLQPVAELLGPIITQIGDILGIIGSFMLDTAISGVTMNITLFADALALLMDIFGIKTKQAEKGTGVLEGIALDIKSIGDACSQALGAVKEFFDALFGDIRKLLGLPEKEAEKANETNQNGGGLFAGVKNFLDTNEFIQTAQGWIDNAKTNISKWFNDLPNIIGDFINSLLYEKHTNTVFDQHGNNIATSVTYIETPFKQWLDKVIEIVSNFIIDLPSNLLKGVGKITDFFSLIIDTIFGNQGNKENTKTKKTENATQDAVHEWADKFLQRLKSELIILPYRVRGFILRTRVKFKVALEKIKTWFNTDENVKMIKEWGASIFNSIKDFILKLPEHIKNVIRTVGATGRTVIGVIKELFKPEDVAKETQKDLEDGFKGISIASVLDAIADIGREIANQFISWFTGSDNMEENFTWVEEQFNKLIRGIPVAISDTINFVVEKLGGFWEKIYDAITGTSKDKDSIDSRVGKELSKLTDKDGKLHIGIENIPKLLESSFFDTIDAVNALWDQLMNAITGKNKKPMTSAMKKQIELAELDDSNFPISADALKQHYADSGYDVPGVKTGLAKFADELAKSISEIFSSLPLLITNGLNDAIGLINSALETLTANLNAGLAESTEEVADTSDEVEKGSLQEAFIKLGDSLKTLILTRIPGAITAAFENVKKNANETWLPALRGIFDNINEDTQLQEKLKAAGDSIVKWIEDLPEKIRAAFSDVKAKIKALLNPEEALGDGTVTDAAKGSLDAIGNETEKEVEKSTLWSTLTGIATNIGDALKKAFDDLWPDIQNTFASLPTYIVKGMTAAATAINSAIGGLGDWFSNSLKNGEDNKTAKETAEGAVADLTKAATEGTEQAAQENDFITAIKGLGSVIWLTITETIPKSISEAFNWVKENWDKEGGWKDSLLNIFTGVTGIKPEDINIDTILSSLKATFESIPQRLSDMLNGAKTFLGIKDSASKQMHDALVDPMTPDVVKDQIRSSLDSSGYNPDEILRGTTMWDTMLGLGQTIGQAITSGLQWAIDNLGDIIVNGWNNSLSTVSKLLGSMSDWFGAGSNEEDGSLGKSIQKNFGNIEPGLQTALNNIGITIKNLFVHTIPRFIGDAIGTIIHELPTMWKELWAGVTETATKSAKDTKGDDNPLAGAEEAVKDTSQVLGDVLDSVKSTLIAGTLSSSATLIVGLLALMEIFKLIKEVIGTFNVTGNIAERAGAVNSVEAVFKRMLTALIAAMALVAYVSTLDDTKFSRVKEILTQLTDTLKIIAGLYTVGSLGTSYMDMRSGAKEDKEAMKMLTNKEKLFTRFTDVAGGMLSAVKGVGITAGVSAGINMVGSSVSDVVSQFIGNFGELGQAVSSFSESIGTAFDEIGGMLTKIKNAKTVLDETLTLMQTVSTISTYTDQVKTANGIFGDLTGSLGLFAQQFAGDLHPAEVVQAIKDIMGMTEEMTTFANYTSETDAFDRFKEAIGSLGAALSFYNNANGMTEEMTTQGISNAVKVLKAIVNNNELMSLADTLSSGEVTEDAKNIYTSAERLALFAGALAQFGSAISGLTTESVEAFSKFYNDVVTKISIDDVRGDTEGSSAFAQKMHTLGEGLSSFASSAKDLNAGDVTVAGYALDMLATIAERAKRFENGVLVGWVAGTGDLGRFALNIGTVGQKLRDFLKNISLDDNSKTIEYKFESVKTAMLALQQLSTAATRLKGIDPNAITNLLGDGATMGQAISKVMWYVTRMYNPDNDEGVDATYDEITEQNAKFELINEVLTTFNKFAQGIASFANGKETTGSVLKALTNDSTGIVALSTKIMEMFKTLSDENTLKSVKMDTVREIVGIVNSLFDAVSGMHIFNIFQGVQAYNGAEAMRVVIDALGVLNDDITVLTTFLDNAQTLVGKYNVSEISGIVNIIKILGEGLSAFATNNLSDVSFASDGLMNLQTMNMGALRDAVINILGALDATLADTEMIEQLKRSGKTIAGYLFEGIEAAFTDPIQPLQPHITPVLELDTARQQLQQFFGLGEGDTFDITSAMSGALQGAFGANQEHPDYTTILAEIRDNTVTIGDKVDNVSVSVGNVSTAIDGMKVYIDGDRLVGEIGTRIDSYIGWLGNMYLRQQVTSVGDWGQL